MAEAKTKDQETQKSNEQSLARRDRGQRGLQRRDPAAFTSPLQLMDWMGDEMDRWFDRVSRDFGFPRRSRFSRGPFGRALSEGAWSPHVEAFQKDDRLIVRADLPGLKKDDVQVELTDDTLTIRGERREEREEERGGYYHSEREYGEFYRTIPLPEGVITESAQASFRDGVLEVTMQAAPAEASRGRRLEIKDASESQPKK